MKLNITSACLALALMGGAASCTDKVAFGNDFLEKPAGGTVTADTVFSNPEYTRQFLANIYAYQYYDLNTRSSNDCPQWLNYFHGSPDALGDDYQLLFSGSRMFSAYYNGALTSNADGYGNYNAYPYNNMYIWQNVRHCLLLMENIDNVPGMDAAEKARMKDEAKCLLAMTYYNAFRWYGGLPLIDHTFTGTETEYETGRGSLEETVEFMVKYLDEVITAKNLPWAYEGSEAQSETGHWTLAGAMALKCKVLLFAASPLCNADQPYYAGKYEMPDNGKYVWYGNYDKSRWTRVRTACKAFFDEMGSRGHYHLLQPTAKTQEAYRYAYRAAYIKQNSPEVIHSVRVSNNAKGNDYAPWNLGWKGNNERFSYCPTEEFAERFCWADGTPFSFEKAKAEGKLDEMFIKGTKVQGKQQLQNRVLTRDPRMYETMAVNGTLKALNWDDGKMSGENWEMWVGGTHAAQGPATNKGVFGTGYRNLKHMVGDVYQGKKPQWCPLLLSDMYFAYAEAIIQDGGAMQEAVDLINAVRARVGLGDIVACNPDKSLLSDRNALLEEVMRERNCDLAFQNERYFDMIRYKRADLFEKPLHKLLIYRLDANGQRVEKQWYKDCFNKKLKEDDPNFYEPSHFDYVVEPITTGARVWWSQGFDPKWYFQPFPVQEVNKNYGLVQNPGW